LTLDVSADLIAPERAVLGSEYFRYDELAANLALLQTHEQLICRIITHEFPVQRLAEAFKVFLAGETGKIVITQEIDR
jgi:threonine dehydrogenase-like Zn-dependent dehydrogenase